MISVIIPVYNEAAIIRSTVRLLLERGGKLIHEVIVSDGGSRDRTRQEAQAGGATVIKSPKKGRAAQMNEGAAHATGKILYFLHADSIPPIGFAEEIISALQNDCAAGCFRLLFDYNHWFLKSQAWFTRFDVDAFRYGDQSLFVTKQLFHRVGGFDGNLVVFEDNEIIRRIKRAGKFSVRRSAVQTSARKYIDNGIYRTQFIFYLLYTLYVLGFSQQTMVRAYRRLLRQDKV